MKISPRIGKAVGIVLLCLLVSLLFAVAKMHHGEGPSYKGRRLSAWIDGLDTPRRMSSEEAIRNIGTNALPYIVDQLQCRKDERRIQNTLIACESLGVIAAPAVREVAALMDSPAHYHIATRALARMGSIGVETVVACVTNHDQSLSFQAVQSLEIVGPAASNAVPLLLSCITSHDSELRCQAARTLGAIGSDAEKVVPALKDLLMDENPWVRRAAIYGLGQFGERARLAVPELIKFLDDRDEHTRFLAAAWLQTIDAKALEEWRSLKKAFGTADPSTPLPYQE